MANDTPRKKSLLDRFLTLFGDVHAGEGRQLILLLVNVFLILFAYYILKSVREGLLTGGFLGLSSVNTKIVVAGASAGLLFIVVPLYSQLVDKVSRLRLLNVCMAFVVVSLLVFFGLGRAGVRIGAAFYLWLSVVNVFLIAQFWSYANDLYSEAAGKRLFAIIAIGGSAGAIVGAWVTKQYTEFDKIMPAVRKALGEAVKKSDDVSAALILLLAAAAIVALVALLYNVTERQAKKAAPDAKVDVPTAVAKEPSSGGSFALVFRSRYLLLIAVMIMLTNIVNTTGEFILFSAADAVSKSEHPDAEFAGIDDEKEREKATDDARGKVITAFYGNFFFWVNLLGFLLQAFIVSRIFKFFGVRAALFVLPVIAFGGYALIGIIGAVLVIRLAKTVENATDYSLQNTVKQALFLPTSREEKYKAKAAIDTFFVRGGDLMASAISLGLGIGLGFGLKGYAAVNVGFAALWIFITILIAREHKKIAEE